MNPKGIIFTGGPNSVYKEESPRCSKEIFDLGIPVLGICYGAQLMSYLLGGEVATAPVSEYGKTEVEVDTTSKLYRGCIPEDHMLDEPYRLYFQDAGRFPCDSPYSGLPDCRYGKMKKKAGTAFRHIRRYFIHRKAPRCCITCVYSVCHCAGDWKMDAFVEKSIEEIRKKVGKWSCPSGSVRRCRLFRSRRPEWRKRSATS